MRLTKLQSNEQFSQKIQKHFGWTAKAGVDTEVAKWGMHEDGQWVFGFNKTGTAVCKMSRDLYTKLLELK